MEQLEQRLALAAVSSGLPRGVVPPDPNDQISEAVVLGQIAPGTIDSATDVDMFSFKAAAGERVTLDLDRKSGTLDSYLRLFDAHGTQLAFSNDATAPGETPSKDSCIAYTFPKAGTYYVGVSASHNAHYGPITGDGDTNGTGIGRIGTGRYDIIVTHIPHGPPPPSPSGGFSITVSFARGITTSQQSVFNLAAARWAEVITGDLPNATYAGRVVDDLLIDVSGIPIDGVGGILSQQGHPSIRSGSGLPYHGLMQFDTADLARTEASGRLYDVVLHEMGRVLGIGTLWTMKGLLTGLGTANPRFIGPHATREYNSMTGVQHYSVPVEAAAAAGGSRWSAWRESEFGDELMTAFMQATGNPLSRITVASLADLGYTVNMNVADPYTLPHASPVNAAAASRPGSSHSLVLAIRPEDFLLVAGGLSISQQPASAQQRIAGVSLRPTGQLAMS